MYMFFCAKSKNQDLCCFNGVPQALQPAYTEQPNPRLCVCTLWRSKIGDKLASDEGAALLVSSSVKPKLLNSKPYSNQSVLQARVLNHDHGLDLVGRSVLFTVCRVAFLTLES